MFCKGDIVSLKDVSRLLNAHDNNTEDPTQCLSLKEILKNKEIESILNAIEAANGNKTKAATILGITYRWLAQRLNRYGIEDIAMKDRS
ncbi:MAG: hypothetical protein HQL03_16035 [Nitrospirae bacterium]|nr:hypothetical protein [Nitrospirota bacterium]